ncbi:META domain-containing protein [Bizionia argentinensis JUB59]|uniref:META domain-containing protein n=1 Tax=Bizionia argentinensis JUB59 TaxID=1046627 RepID=G2ECX0_9FLAO|nr:META domain-containing protein [Bizionia argentinensis]EGV43788.1 META domain-containing protein [Bizionia argentinensis JUB59]
MKTKIITLSIIAVAFMSCNSGKKSETNDSLEVKEEVTQMETPTIKDEVATLENTKWVITKLEGKDMTDREKNGQIIHFVLDSETNSISGFSGCNTFMGTYKMEEGGRVSFSKLGSTRMACPDAKIDESLIINIFETADNFRITNNTLELNKAKMAPLAEFKKVVMDNEITETYWKLKTLDGKAVTMADNQEREIYFTLKNDGNRVTGFAGCNGLSGEYMLEDGNRIRFVNMATTLKACPDVDVNESAFLKIFELTDNYTVNNETLSLNVGKRAPLAVFEAVYFD